MMIYKVMLEKESTRSTSNGTVVVEERFYQNKDEATKCFEQFKRKADQLMDREYNMHSKDNKGYRETWDNGNRYTALVQCGDSSYNNYIVTIKNVTIV